ncbi:MAG: trypsin-like peptidase domain-containing protein [Myxococcaceae bacterium]|nr:trypsin-like peptidase domain-containing protein [Myxococcaceae bacterium]
MTTLPPTFLERLSNDLDELVARAMPAVVGVELERGQGTGLVLTPDGYVLTNSHVVRGARTVKVRRDDGEALSAMVIGADPPTDLAVLRVDARDLPTLPLADPAQVRVGQLVVAIGHPFQLEGSVSVGVVSALNRSLGTRAGLMEGLVQTDAAINPGNSGGPLLNARGEVVGINSIVLPYAQGIGFAISAGTASWIASMLIQKGKVPRKFIGVAASAVPLPRSQALEVGQSRAVRIHRVGEGSPAALGGLREGDLVTGVNGSPVRSVDDLQRLMSLAPDTELHLDVWRKGGRRALTVTARSMDA